MQLCVKVVFPLLQLLQQPLLLLLPAELLPAVAANANPLLHFDASQQQPELLQRPTKPKPRKFLIYDPKTGRQLEPLQYLPIVLGNKRKPSKPTGNLVELPLLWNPCSCMEFVCMCCLGLQFGDAFNHRICVSVQFNAADFGIQLGITHNRRNIATFGFSARNPPSYCIPILLPLPLFGCLRLYNIRLIDGNVQLCWSLMLNLFMSQLFEFQFDCVRFGVNGVQFFKPPTLFNNMNVTSAEELDGDADEELRHDVQLGEDYSGISLEDGRAGADESPLKGRVHAKADVDTDVQINAKATPGQQKTLTTQFSA